MADSFLDGAVQTPIASSATPNLDGLPFPFAPVLAPNADPWASFLTDGAGGHAASPIDTARAGTAGSIVTTFGDDWYDRIHVEPGSFALGNILGDSNQIFVVWNAHRTVSAKTLLAIGENNTAGLSLQLPGALPFSFSRLQAFEDPFSLDVSSQGPAEVNATFTFNFSGESPTLDVTGQRVVLLPFCAEKPFKEGLLFETDVISSFNGTESRVRARTLPRQSFNMDYWVSDPELRRKFLNLVTAHGGKVYGVPMFQWARPLGASMVADVDTAVTVDTTLADFRDSTSAELNLIVLWRSESDYEIGTVAIGGMADAAITLSTAVLQNHTVGDTLVVPLQLCVSRDPIEFSEYPTGQMMFRIGWLDKAYTDRADLTSLTQNVLPDDGRPILDGPNFISGTTLDQTIKTDYEMQDSGSGVFEIIETRDIAQYRTVKGFNVRTASDAWALRGILYGLNGKQTSFWLPSFREDFVVTDDIGAADLNITIADQDFHLRIQAREPYTGLRLEMNDGTIHYRTITGTSAVVGSNEYLTIGQSLGVPVLAADIRKASIMYLSRLGSDRIDINWTDSTGSQQVRVPVVGAN